MSASNAIPAFGTFLKSGDGVTPTETFTTIAEVKSITGPQMSAKIDDVTNHSTGTPWREKLATLLDGGTVAFDLNFIPSDATQSYSTGMLKDFAGRVRRNYNIVFPDAAPTTWAFKAYVQDFKVTAAVDGVLTAAVTLAITGVPTLA